MLPDPVVEAIRKLRDEYAAQFDNDLDAIYEDLRRRQKSSERKLVTFVNSPPFEEPLSADAPDNTAASEEIPQEAITQ